MSSEQSFRKGVEMGPRSLQGVPESERFVYLQGFAVIHLPGGFFDGGGPSAARSTLPGGGEHAFQKIIFSTDEGHKGLLPDIERFEFLQDNQVPEKERDDCWSGTMARILGITPRKQ